MSNYTKTTDFATKDTLLPGDSNKIVRGSEIDTEFSNIQTAVNSKANTASPTLTGTPAAPTATVGTATTQIATTAFVGNTLNSCTSDIAMNGAIFSFAKGADVSSLVDPLPLVSDGNYFDVTGAGTVTAFDTMAVGTLIALQFDSTVTLTHDGINLFLPTEANIVTETGDTALFIEEDIGVWRCLSYQRATGETLLSLPINSSVTTAATSFTISSIPEWATKITVSFFSLGTNGTSPLLARLNNENTGYLGSCVLAGTGASASNYTTGHGLTDSMSSSQVLHGQLVLQYAGGNLWSCTSTLARSDGAGVHIGASTHSVSATLSSIVITTSGGVNTLDAGSTISWKVE